MSHMSVIFHGGSRFDRNSLSNRLSDWTKTKTRTCMEMLFEKHYGMETYGCMGVWGLGWPNKLIHMHRYNAPLGQHGSRLVTWHYNTKHDQKRWILSNLQTHINITLFNHVGRFHDLKICQLYFMGPWTKVGIFVYYSMNIFMLNLGTQVESYSLPTLCPRIIVHPSIILTIINYSSTITENADTIQNILTIHIDIIHYFIGVNFILFSKFLPVR